jgi:prophage maintenance system killer protein
MKNKKEEQVVIYQTEDGSTILKINIADDTIWMTQSQMVALFGKSKQNISLHINNIFKEGELDDALVVKESSITATDGKQYKTKQYNLDVIISLGYRVKSQLGTQFRLWANKILREYLHQGYSINQEYFDQNSAELQQALAFIRKATQSPEIHAKSGQGLGEIVSRYTQTFLWLQRYDEGLLNEPAGQIGGGLPSVDEAMQALQELKQSLMACGEATELFATSPNDGLASILGNLAQSISGEQAYPTIESKAAHLLYFVVKNHPFVDGNKRSGAFLFVDFLHRNARLMNARNEMIINDTGLAALTLLVAESDPKQKDILIRLIMNMLARKN